MGDSCELIGKGGERGWEVRGSGLIRHLRCACNDQKICTSIERKITSYCFFTAISGDSAVPSSSSARQNPLRPSERRRYHPNSSTPAFAVTVQVRPSLTTNKCSPDLHFTGSNTGESRVEIIVVSNCASNISSTLYSRAENKLNETSAISGCNAKFRADPLSLSVGYETPAKKVSLGNSRPDFSMSFSILLILSPV